jgi:hypothetical protein
MLVFNCSTMRCDNTTCNAETRSTMAESCQRSHWISTHRSSCISTPVAQPLGKGQGPNLNPNAKQTTGKAPPATRVAGTVMFSLSESNAPRGLDGTDIDVAPRAPVGGEEQGRGFGARARRDAPTRAQEDFGIDDLAPIADDVLQTQFRPPTVLISPIQI